MPMNVGTACLCRFCGSYSGEESQAKGEIAVLGLDSPDPRFIRCWKIRFGRLLKPLLSVR